MHRVRGFSENINKSPRIIEEDLNSTLVQSVNEDFQYFGTNPKRIETRSSIRNPKNSSSNSVKLCNGLFNLIKSTQCVDVSFLKINGNRDVCGKCKSCHDIQEIEEDKKLILKTKASSVVFGRINTLQSPTIVDDKNHHYNHFEFSVTDASDLHKQKIDYYKSIEIMDFSDWESDWMYYKRNQKFESYVRRYILHSETPIEQIPDTMLLTGFLCGILLAQILLLIIVVIYNWSIIRARFTDLIIMWRIMRSILFSIIFIFLIAINIYVWQIFGINHVLIFELDPRSHLKYQKIIKISALFGNIWCCTLINFILCDLTNIQLWIWPLICVATVVAWIGNPLPFANYKARRWLLNVALRIILTPFSQVNFSEFWFADQLNSMSFLFVDLFSGVYLWVTFLLYKDISISPSHNSTNTGRIVGKNQYRAVSISFDIQIMIFLVIKITIVWFRLGQCMRRYLAVRRVFPHLVNAGKYFSSMLTIVFTVLKLKHPSNNQLFHLFILSYSINSIYTYLWDICMDWNLFVWKKRTFVLREILYRKEFYILAAVSNGIIRCFWILILFTTDEFVISVGLFLEMVRRFIWNFFRVENEHLNNCGNFRAVREK